MALISHDVHSPEVLDDLPSALEKKLENEVEASDEVELNRPSSTSMPCVPMVMP
jgi:hypothetical protein